jgi:hypothetical protein
MPEARSNHDTHKSFHFNSLYKTGVKTINRKKHLPGLSILALSGVLFLGIFAILSSYHQAAYAQSSSSGQSSGQNSSSTNSSSITPNVPTLDKLSDKKIYRVQLRFTQLPIDPRGSEVEVTFLNASAAITPANQTFIQNSTNQRSVTPRIAGPYVEPGTLQPLMPVKSFDMIIYSNDGKELWKKVNQPVHAGAQAERIAFNSNYTGPITIDITNIRGDVSANGTETASTSNTVDSVKFTTVVAPEFPFAIFALVGGTAAALALARLKMAGK